MLAHICNLIFAKREYEWLWQPHIVSYHFTGCVFFQRLSYVSYNTGRFVFALTRIFFCLCLCQMVTYFSCVSRFMEMEMEYICIWCHVTRRMCDRTNNNITNGIKTFSQQRKNFLQICAERKWNTSKMSFTEKSRWQTHSCLSQSRKRGLG